MGIPTVMLARKDFVGVIRNLMSGRGFAPDTSMVIFPIESFLPGSGTSPIRSRKQEFYDGLTRWPPAGAGGTPGESRMFAVEHAQGEDASLAANRAYAQRLSGDGLPLLPTTRERVDWILRGSVQQNLGGALPGVGAMAMYGAMRYTNAVFAEDETGLPEGWLPHGTERHGYARGTNSVSLVFANGATNIKRRSAIKETPEEDVLQGMHRIADVLAGAQLGSLVGYREGTPGILMIPQVVAQMMAGLKWTKASIREFLWEHSKVPMERLRRSGARQWTEIQAPEAFDALLAEAAAELEPKT